LAAAPKQAQALVKVKAKVPAAKALVPVAKVLAPAKALAKALLPRLLLGMIKAKAKAKAKESWDKDSSEFQRQSQDAGQRAAYQHVWDKRSRPSTKTQQHSETRAPKACRVA
jgi:hypothetical protein